jgi:hypothetical protein
MFNIFDLFKGFGGSSYASISIETEKKIKYEWSKINDLLKLRGPSQLRQAMISADKTLDNALRDIVAGESMGERLKNSESRFDRGMYNSIWEAHKVRNNLVHESGFEPPYYILVEKIEVIRMALLNLGIKV